MMIKIEVNNRIVQARKGETILSALEHCGIKVPTLCSMAELTPTGACRMCVVEVEGYEKLVPACSFQVNEWMKIKTHSPRVLRARKTNVELLLSSHPDDCLYCERNGNCELQTLAEDLNVRERRMQGEKSHLKKDYSAFGIVRDPDKCILCSRCVRICEEIIGVSTLDFVNRGNNLAINTAMAKPMAFSNCIECGQCLISCPTGALIDKSEVDQLDEMLHDPNKVVVVQYTPAVTVSLAEEFHLKGNVDMKGVLNAALRKIGFDYVFDASFGGDVVVMEQATELMERIGKEENLPMISASCPAFVKYVEEFRPELIPFLTTVMSPHQIVGSLIKTWFAKLNHLSEANIFSVLLTSCTAAKYETHFPEKGEGGKAHINAVITIRELVRLIRLNGIDMNALEPEPADGPFHSVTSAGKLFAAAGGETEATLRTLYYLMDNSELQEMRLSKIRGSRDIRELSVPTTRRDVNVGSVSGLKNAIQILDEIGSGKRKYDFLEIMVCPDGCVGGGGQLIPLLEHEVRSRIKMVYESDKKETLKVAHKNHAVKKMYEEMARTPWSQESRELLHTCFMVKKVLK